MNPLLYKVATAMVSNVTKQGGYVTATKLLKLLYLFDVEYYRKHAKTFTGFEWTYYLLGPWSQEYYSLVEKLTAENGPLVTVPSAKLDHDTSFYKAREYTDVFGLLPPEDESILRIVLNTWAEKTTAQILDYIYFRTEPIEYGERYKPLDFSLVPKDTPPKYARSSSGKTPEEIKKLKKRFKAKLAATAGEEQSRPVTPPRYDDAFFEMLSKLETLE